MFVQTTPLIFIFIGILLGSLVLTYAGARLGSWKLVWLGALTSLFLSILTGFSIGPFLFLLTCLQLGSALALRWRVGGSGTIGMLLLAVAVWFLTEPFQLLVYVWISLLGGMLLVPLLAALATIWSPDVQVGSHTG